MPYIPGLGRREQLRPVSEACANSEAELNFQISCLLNDYILQQSIFLHGLSYDKMKDCTSACANAAHEFRRRIMDPYERLKLNENGDIYDPQIMKALNSLEPF